MKIIIIIICCLTLLTSAHSQTMDFSNGASEPGFTFSGWSAISGAIYMTSLSSPATVTVNSGYWNFESFEVGPFTGNNTMQVTSNLGDSYDYNTDTIGTHILNWTNVTTVTFTRLSGSGASADHDNFSYSITPPPSDVVVSIPNDNCLAPLPNSGTYIEQGSLNGKSRYIKNANLQIVWTGTQWEIQGDNPGGAVSFTTAWFNTHDTPTPPEGCWQSSFGCSVPIISGQDAFPMETISSIVNIDANPTTAQTVNYLVTFSGRMNDLTSTNFTLTEGGTVAGATITNLVQNTDSTWTVTVDRGIGDGTLTLNIDNVIDASAVTCPLPYTGSTYTIPTITAVENISMNTIIEVYPNPIKDNLVIEFKNSNESISLQLINTVGQVVYTQNIQAQQKLELNTIDLNSGVYFLNIQLESGKQFKKTLIK